MEKQARGFCFWICNLTRRVAWSIAERRVVCFYKRNRKHDDVILEMTILTIDRGYTLWLLKKLWADLVYYHNPWIMHFPWGRPIAWDDNDPVIQEFIDDPIEGLVTMYDEKKYPYNSE